MTMIANQKVECKKCGTVYERLKIYSISFHPGENNEDKKKLIEDAKKACPKCGGSKVEEIDYTETTREKIKNKLIQISIIISIVIALSLMILGGFYIISWFV
jgi:Zn finger protein HypA/HybF involved in hydrogenase expression